MDPVGMFLSVLWWCGMCFALVVALVAAAAVIDCCTFRPHLPGKRKRSLGNRRFNGRADIPADVDVVVVGSGQGGLSCASVLSQFGYKCVVFEQHIVAGGGGHCFAVDGRSKWRFDAGHHITIPQHELVLQLACGSPHLPVPFDKLRDPATGASDYIVLGEAPPGETPLPVYDSDKRLAADLVARFPEHATAIKEYFQLAEELQKRFGLFILSSILPAGLRSWVLKQGLFDIWRRWSGVTAADGLKEIFPGDDQNTCVLRSYMVGLWLDTGSPPGRGSFFMQTAVFGGWQKLGLAYPRGGPQETILAMVDAIESRGGRVFVGTPVQRIVVEAQPGNGNAAGKAIGVVVRSEKSEVEILVRGKRVVSSLGYRTTEQLLSSRTKHHRIVTPQSSSFLMANVALKGTAEELGINASNVWLQPATAANGYSAEVRGCDEYFADPLNCAIELIPAGITFPSCKDRGGPSATRHHTCQILVPAEWRWFDRHAPLPEYSAKDLRHGARHAPPHVPRSSQKEYDALKKRWADRLVALLLRYFPAIDKDEHIAFVDVSTPMTIERYLRSGSGGAIGLDVTPPRFVNSAEIRELDMKHPRVEGLYRAGQDYLMHVFQSAAAS